MSHFFPPRTPSVHPKIEPLGLVNLIDPLLITFTRWELFSKRVRPLSRMILQFLIDKRLCLYNQKTVVDLFL